MSEAISFFVAGIPRPGGSKTACLIPKRGGGFVHNAKGRPIINQKDAGKYTPAWRADVRSAARDAYQGEPLDCPLLVEMTFVMPRPKGHYRTGKFSNVLRDDAPTHHTSAPDALKLARSTEDALTGILWKDDSRTAKLNIEKVYGDRAGVHITVRPIQYARPVAAMTPAPLFPEGRVA